ncbi:MAG: stage III sporulation protein AD [Lachnospiraceae bacterium]|nr:stage III sporulation protein AD [Lachnospiraceae bacterium]
MFQVAITAIAAALLAVQLKQAKPEYGVYIGLAAGVVILWFTTDQIGQVLSSIELLEQYVQIDAVYWSVLLKITGITYLSEFAGNICRDAGYQALAGQVELFAKILIMALGIPVVLALLETIESLM